MYQGPPPSYSSPEMPVITNPWRGIWRQPRATIRMIVNTNPNRDLLLLISLYGLGQSIGLASSLGQLGVISVAFPLNLLLALVVAPLLGAIAMAIGAGLMHLAARMLGSQTPFPETRAALLWSSVPTMAGVLLWIPVILERGAALFQPGPRLLPRQQTGVPWLDRLSAAQQQTQLQEITGALQTVLSLWGLVLLVICLSEVHRFTIGRAIGTIFLFALFLVIPICVLIFVVLAAAM
jgi:hypothetical protein